MRFKTFFDDEFPIFSKKVLEIGCGEGQFTGLLQRNNDVTPTDIRCPKNKLDNFVQADARSLPFADNTFDVVFGNFILHHIVGDMDKVVKESSRVLKPGGHYYGAEPNGWLLYPWIALVSYIIPIAPRFKGDDERPIHANNVKKIFDSNGFETKITHRMTFLPIFHDRLSFIKNKHISTCMVIKARKS